MIKRSLRSLIVIAYLAAGLFYPVFQQPALAAGTVSLYGKDSLPGNDIDLGMMVFEVPPGALHGGDTFTLTLPENFSFNTTVPAVVGNSLDTLTPSTVNVVYPAVISGKVNAITGDIAADYSGMRTLRVSLASEPGSTNPAILYVYLMGIHVPTDFRGDVKIKITSSSGWPEANEAAGGESVSGDKTGDQEKTLEPDQKGKDLAPAPAVNARFKIGEKSFNLNGSKVTMDTAPFILDNRTYVPVRYVAKASGIPDEYISFENNTVIIKWGNRTAKLVPGSSVITLDSMSLQMDVPVQVVDGRTFVPLRWVCEAFGLKVAWDSESQTVTIITEGNAP